MHSGSSETPEVEMQSRAPSILTGNEPTHADPENTTLNYEMHPMRMHFLDPNIEEQYRQDNYLRQIGLTRFCIAMGAVVFSAYGILDYYIVPDILFEAWFIRFGIVAPLLLGIVALSYAPWFSHKHQFWLSVSMAAPGLGAVAMIALAEAPGSYLYYGGLVAIICFSACLWRLNFMYSLAWALATFAAYEVVALFINPQPHNVMINNTAFMLLGIGTCNFLNYVQEHQMRKSFVDHERLKQERSRSESLLATSEAANRAKNDFLAIMSHELRTPLNAIIGFSEIIATQMFGPINNDRYADYASDIRSSGSHLLSIINDILDLSKAEAGKLELDESSLDPVESLNQIMRMFRPRAADLKIKLTFRVRDDIPWILADGRLFNQVVINLTSNALKFTPEGGKVSVELGMSETGELEFKIEDTGIGIDENDIERVFEPFVQVENAMSRTQHGTGLGLPLVRKIMALHGGDIRLTSTKGVGTKVTATIPVSRFVAAPANDGKSWASK
jgi:signal transduction histidine kinase